MIRGRGLERGLKRGVRVRGLEKKLKRELEKVFKREGYMSEGQNESFKMEGTEIEWHREVIRERVRKREG